MQLFFDFFPILLFFLVYKLYNIFVATACAMGAVVLQMIITYTRGKRPDLMQIITLMMILILGGATLFFKNELFIKWKPTVVYWILASIFGISQLMGKNLVKKMLEKSLTLPSKAWNLLSTTWYSFFLVMGALNLAVAYLFSTDIWVNFKLFGTLGLTFVFVIIQGIVVSRYLPKQEQV